MGTTMEFNNKKIYSIYEKYLSAGCNTDTEDENGTDIDDDDAAFELASPKAPSKGGRPSSASALNTTMATKASIEEKVAAMECQMNAFMTDLANQNSDTLEIPKEIRTILSKIGDEKASMLIGDLHQEFVNKQKQESAAVAQQKREKYNLELASIRQLIEEEESAFTREMKIIEQQNFTDMFRLDDTTDAGADLDAKLAEIRANATLLDQEIVKYTLCKRLGFESH